MKSKHFRYEYRFAGLVDIGKSRKSNQDEVILSPERGFFAVSDGMGGLDPMEWEDLSRAERLRNM